MSRFLRRRTNRERSICARVSCQLVPTLVATETAINQESRFVILASSMIRCIIAIVSTTCTQFEPPGSNFYLVQNRISSGHHQMIVVHYGFVWQRTLNHAGSHELFQRRSVITKRAIIRRTRVGHIFIFRWFARCRFHHVVVRSRSLFGWHSLVGLQCCWDAPHAERFVFHVSVQVFFGKW